MSKISFYTEETFLKKLDSLYPNRDYKIISPFIRGDLRILIENKYGICSVIAKTLLNGAKGDIKTAVDVDIYRTNMFKEKHNNKYSYPNYTYCGNRCDAKIECPVHGEFLQSSDVHLMGSGCSACTFLEGERINGYSRSGFIKKAKDRECNLYLV